MFSELLVDKVGTRHRNGALARRLKVLKLCAEMLERNEANSGQTRQDDSP